MIDIGANLTDDMFKGVYHGKQKHRNDLNDVLERSTKAGVKTIILTVGCTGELEEARNIVKQHMNLYYTLGIHPTRANTFNPHNINIIKREISKLMNFVSPLLNQLPKSLYTVIHSVQSKYDINCIEQPISDDQLITKWLMYGEFGLDYDRLQFSSKDQQIQAFKGQLPLAAATGLPLFLHARGSGAVDDLLRIIEDFCRENDFLSVENVKKQNFFHGVVHSFTGTAAEALRVVEAGFYVGVNGCSFKNVGGEAVVLAVGLERLLTETDCPYCGVKRGHWGFGLLECPADQRPKPEKFIDGHGTKDRAEPADVDQIIQILAGITAQPREHVIQAVQNNMENMIMGTTAAFFFQK